MVIKVVGSQEGFVMDISIVGAGIFGLASAIELRQRGHKVTVFDQGAVPYERATSTDVSKAIRRVWYSGDNETYVELVERSAARWREWEMISGESFYQQVGGLTIIEDFEPNSPLYESYRYLEGRGCELEVLSPVEARKRFPQFIVRDSETCLYDPWTGYLESGLAVNNLSKIARADGVVVLEGTPVLGVADSKSGVIVDLESGSVDFDRVIVAAGVWLGHILPEISKHVLPTHQEMVLIEVDNPEMFAHGAMPVWSIHPSNEMDELWYGFPLLREGYVKVSNEPVGEIVGPDVDRTGSPEFEAQAMEFLRGRIPGIATGRLVEGRVCLYANTPDDHFVIDWCPGYERVLVAGGGSGHGFKFGGSIGQIIADALEDLDSPLGHRFKIGNRFAPNPKTGGRSFRGFANPQTA